MIAISLASYSKSLKTSFITKPWLASLTLGSMRNHWLHFIILWLHRAVISHIGYSLMTMCYAGLQRSLRTLTGCLRAFNVYSCIHCLQRAVGTYNKLYVLWVYYAGMSQSVKTVLASPWLRTRLLSLIAWSHSLRTKVSHWCQGSRNGKFAGMYQ